jgi:hypothetical protein
MAIFATGSVQSSAVADTSSKVFDTTSSLYATGAYLTNLTIVNTGANSIYVGSFTGVTAITGLLLNPGSQLTFHGYSHVKGDTTGDVYAICASGKASSVKIGLATVDGTS